VEDRQRGAARPPGLLDTLRRLAGSAVALLQTRAQLLATEIDEERTRVVRLLLLSVIAGFFLTIGVVTLTIFVILLAGDAHRLLVAGLLTALYLGIGAAVALNARELAKARSKLFSASLAELRKDRDELAS